MLEEAITTDFALVRAAVADRHGNLRLPRRRPATSTRSAAMAGRITIVEAEQVVEAGEIDPDDVHLPGIFVAAGRPAHTGAGRRQADREAHHDAHSPARNPVHGEAR